MTTIIEHSIEELRDFLATMDAMKRKMMGERLIEGEGLQSPEGFVLAHGRHWATMAPRKVKRGPMKQCFMNSFKYATSGRAVTYVEGYALGLIPTLHAWCVDTEGRVIETTWERQDGIYFGVPFNIEYVLKRVVATGCYVSMLDNYTERWPLLGGRHSVTEAVKVRVGRAA